MLCYIGLCADLNLLGRLKKEGFAAGLYISLKDETDSCTEYEQADTLIGCLEIIRKKAPFLVREAEFQYADNKARETLYATENPDAYDEWRDYMDFIEDSDREMDSMFRSLRQ